MRRSGDTMAGLVWVDPAAMLRAACVAFLLAFLLGMGGCGGGGGDTPSASSMPMPTPDVPQPPAASQLVVGTALSIDGGASGDPVGLRVVRSANGDAFGVWQAHAATRRNLWANRYRAATAAWGDPILIEASSADIDDFDLAVDTSGNAVVAWHEPAADPRLGTGAVM